MEKIVKDLQTFIMVLILDAVDEESGGLLTLCLTALTILTIEDDLYKERMTCLYPQAGCITFNQAVLHLIKQTPLPFHLSNSERCLSNSSRPILMQ